MKKTIALILLGMMLSALPMGAAAQPENPTSQQLEAISQALENDTAIQVEIQKDQGGLQNPQAAAQEIDPEVQRLADLDAMAHWPMPKTLALGVKLLVLGMTVVMSVLILIALVTAFLNNQEIKREEEIARAVEAAKKEMAANAPAVIQAAEAAPAGGIDGATVAAIAGAITAVLRGRPFRIKSLKMASNVGSAWSQQGRHSIMASHSLERKSR